MTKDCLIHIESLVAVNFAVAELDVQNLVWVNQPMRGRRTEKLRELVCILQTILEPLEQEFAAQADTKQRFEVMKKQIDDLLIQIDKRV